MPIFLITPAQCRMARAFLNWSQPELAKRCGLATMTISKFEKDDGTTPETKTVEKIAVVFQMAGVSFFEDGGVKPKDNLVTVLEGPDANARLLEDIYDTLKGTGGEVLIAGLTEYNPAVNPEGHAFVKGHIQRLMESGISERIL